MLSADFLAAILQASQAGLLRLAVFMFSLPEGIMPAFYSAQPQAES